MATLKQGGWTYTITPEDKLWAARMVEGEGPVEDAPAVLWTMTQLFAPAGQRAKYGNPHRFRTFTELIQAYSQPINPMWTSTGSACRPGGSHAGTDACSSVRLQRRARIQAMPWSRIDIRKRNVVDRWLAGSLPNPVPNAIEFAAPSVSRSFLGRHPGWTAISGGSNWFLRPPSSLPRVTIGGGVPALVLVVGGAGLAYLGVRWLRRRRRG